MEERDKLRRTEPSNTRIPHLTKNINTIIKDHRQKKWLETLDNCAASSKKLWNTIKSIKNPGRTPSTHYNEPKKIANKLNSQYTPPASTKPTKAFRQLLWKIRKKSSDPLINLSCEQTKGNPAPETRQTKRKVSGPSPSCHWLPNYWKV